MSRAERRQIDVEKLLHWAYQDELPKLQLSSAEGIWDRLAEAGWMGSIERPEKTSQRYASFGLPDRDAERVLKAVTALPDIAIDWAESAGEIMGHFAALLGGRDYGLVGAMRTAALVTMHARMGTRPDWREDEPIPRPVMSERGPTRPAIVGECIARCRYMTGSYCPLRWEPSPVLIAQARADYTAWYAGLTLLAKNLDLDRWEPVGPEAPALPWRSGKTELIKPVVFGVGVPGKMLPLHYPRPVAGPTGAIRPGKAASKVRMMTR